MSDAAAKVAMTAPVSEKHREAAQQIAGKVPYLSGALAIEIAQALATATQEARRAQKEDDLNMVRSQFLIATDKGEAHQRSWNDAMTQAIRVIEAGPARDALAAGGE